MMEKTRKSGFKNKSDSASEGLARLEARPSENRHCEEAKPVARRSRSKLWNFLLCFDFRDSSLRSEQAPQSQKWLNHEIATRHASLAVARDDEKRVFGQSAVAHGNLPLTGFTLLETLVALALIVGALAGPFTLATSGIFNAKLSKNKLTALNLAAEGIEIVRQLRDTNFHAGETDWRGISPICSLPKCTVLNDGQYNVDVNNKPGVALGGPLTPLQYDGASGFYVKSGGTETPFTRTVEIKSITGSPEQMRVISRVTWKDSGNRSVQLQEVLYDWK